MFKASSKAEEIGAHFSEECAGRTFLVTGANTGLGLETCRVLASRKARVVMACRNPQLAEEAIAKVKSAYPEANVEFIALDLSDLDSVRRCAEEYTNRFDRLDVLINNAGVMACPRTLTKQGHETQFGVNHLGHFLLTTLLVPVLEKSGSAEKPSRVVNLSSMAQFIFAPAEGVRFDDLTGEKSYHDWERYGQSKLCNVLFSNELNRRMAGLNVISIALHPGVIMGTDLMRHKSFGYMWRMMTATMKRKGGMSMMMSERKKSIPEGAATTLVVALDPQVKPGGYYADCVETGGKKLHAKATDEELAKRLWDVSEKLVA